MNIISLFFLGLLVPSAQGRPFQARQTVKPTKNNNLLPTAVLELRGGGGINRATIKPTVIHFINTAFGIKGLSMALAPRAVWQTCDISFPEDPDFSFGLFAVEAAGWILFSTASLLALHGHTNLSTKKAYALSYLMGLYQFILRSIFSGRFEDVGLSKILTVLGTLYNTIVCGLVLAGVDLSLWYLIYPLVPICVLGILFPKGMSKIAGTNLYEPMDNFGALMAMYLLSIYATVAYVLLEGGTSLQAIQGMYAVSLICSLVQRIWHPSLAEDVNFSKTMMNAWTIGTLLMLGATYALGMVAPAPLVDAIPNM